MYTLPELPYAYNALEPYIDEATMKIHHDKHHATYVKNLNDATAGLDQIPIEELLQDLSCIPEASRVKVKNNGGGHANHSLFWQIMGAPNGKKPTGKFLDALTSTFGSFDGFQEKFSLAGMGRFGSGWVWLVVENGALAIVDTANQDSPVSEGKKPILTLDVWEHAYYLKYQNLRADYIKAWWNVVNWSEVERRFAA